MRKAVLISMLAALMAVVIPGIDARGGRRGPGAGMPPLDVLAEQLDLTDAQIDQLAELQTSLRKSGISLRSEQQLLRIDLQTELAQDDPDEAKIDSLIEKMAENHAKILRTRVQFRLGMKEILTAEQLEKAKELRREARQKRAAMRRHRRRGRRGGRGAGPAWQAPGFGGPPGGRGPAGDCWWSGLDDPASGEDLPPEEPDIE